MGWNSWNCFAQDVSQAKVEAAADAMVSCGLVDHGWTYVNVDDCWEVRANRPAGPAAGPRRPHPDQPQVPRHEGDGRLHPRQGPAGRPVQQPRPQPPAAGTRPATSTSWTTPAVRRLGVRLPEVRLVQLRRDRQEAQADVQPEGRPGHRPAPLRRHAGRPAAAGPGRPLQLLPVRHGRRLDVGRPARRQLLADDRRHQRQLGQHGRHRVRQSTTPRSPAPATGTTRTCSSSARSAGGRTCTRPG